MNPIHLHISWIPASIPGGAHLGGLSFLQEQPHSREHPILRRALPDHQSSSSSHRKELCRRVLFGFEVSMRPPPPHHKGRPALLKPVEHLQLCQLFLQELGAAFSCEKMVKTLPKTFLLNKFLGCSSRYACWGASASAALWVSDLALGKRWNLRMFWVWFSSLLLLYI